MKACIMSIRPQNINFVYSAEMRKRLENEFDLIPDVTKMEDFETRKEEIKGLDYIFSTWGMPSLSEEQIKEYLPNLKAVFYSAGTVQKFARPFINCGVAIFSAWAANAVPVAEVATAEIILANKGFFRRRVVSRDTWVTEDPEYKYPGNFHTNVGLLGAGQIGKLIIKRLKTYDLNVYVFDPFLPDEVAKELGVIKTSLHEVFRNCNVISNHLANNDQTKGMIDKSCFDLMGPYSVFINTGRGAQVVEKDMIEAMKSHPDRIALLDVTDPIEPPTAGSEIYDVENIRITPHVAGSTGYEVHRMAEYMFDEYKAFSKGEKTKYMVTLKMLETMA